MTALPDEHPLGFDLLGDPVRVAAVRRVLQGGTTATGLDRLTRLAADLLDAPQAQVSLLAEEQVIASIFGSELAADDRQGALADSLCTVTVRLGTPFAVGDAREDERVRDLPPVISGGVRAYLGVPLITTAGLVLGALCVYDHEPRAWTARDVGILGELGASAIAELELRAVSAEKATKAAQLDLALSAAGTGSYMWDLATNELHWDDRLIRIFGYAPETFQGQFAQFVERIHPIDRERVLEGLDRAVAVIGDVSLQYRIVRPDGERWIEARGRVLPGSDGLPASVLGVAYDATELRETQGQLVRLLETMTDAFVSLDREWRFTFLNAEAEKLLGRSRDELLGRSVWEEFPEAVGSLFDQEYRRAVEFGEPTSFETHYPPLDAWFEVRAWPGPDGLSIYFHDVSSRRQAELEREQAVADRERAYGEAEAANARLSLLADASHRFAESLEPAEVLQRLSDVVLPALGEWLVVALTGEAAGPLLQREVPDGTDAVYVVHVAHTRPERLAPLERLVRSLPLSTQDPVGVGAVVRTGKSEWLPEVPDEALVQIAPDPQVLAELRGLEIGTALTLPLISRGRRIGAVSVAEPRTGPVDRALVTDLVARAGVALDNALLYGAERRTGLTLQRSLLPGALPTLPGIDIAVRYRPGATGAFVGGDWYQGVLVGEDLVLCMGDVMGHGMRSAARMGQLRAIVATLALEGHGPGDLLSRLSASSDVLLDLDLATLLVAAYSPGRRTLTVASAGHPPPLMGVVGQEPAYLDVAPGPPIGSLPGSYDETVVEVPGGATLVLYTDGLVEARGEDLGVGLEALRVALRELQLPPEAVADHLLEQLGRGEGAPDDVALLVLSHLEA